MEMITHKTAAPTMIAVRRARSGVGANWRLNQAREANGNKAGSATVAITHRSCRASEGSELTTAGTPHLSPLALHGESEKSAAHRKHVRVHLARRTVDNRNG